jgi:ribosomal protein L29
MSKDNKKKEDLIKELSEKQISLRDMRFGVAGSKSKNVKEQKKVKREIARIKTVLNSSK